MSPEQLPSFSLLGDLSSPRLSTQNSTLRNHLYVYITLYLTFVYLHFPGYLVFGNDVSIRPSIG